MKQKSERIRRDGADPFTLGVLGCQHLVRILGVNQLEVLHQY